MWSFAKSEAPGDWQLHETPTNENLRAVTHTANGAAAVGDSGIVLGRSANAKWGHVVEHGPSADDSNLYDVAVTGDGRRLWFCGDDGALGYYDLPSGERHDASEPFGLTESFRAITALGKRGSEKLLVGSSAGTVVSATAEGTTVRLAARLHPANASSVTAALSRESGVGYILTGSGGLHRTTAHQGWKQVGVPDASTDSWHAAARFADGLFVAGGSGFAAHYDPTDGTWTPYDLGSHTIYGVSGDANGAIAVGGSGTVHQRTDKDWVKAATPTGTRLLDATVTPAPVVVGKDGVVLELAGGVW
ncbi:hypothetical protein [Halarchaeum sp. P4]|uniref:hypothetical protein n=1 Tax=Halarchaeum sp. P4 TaxID=3421639 RepID=UPI003EBD5B80